MVHSIKPRELLKSMIKGGLIDEYKPELDVRYPEYEYAFCNEGMSFVFDMTHMWPDEFEYEEGTDYKAESREKLKVLADAVGRIHGYRVVRFVEVYNLLQCRKRLVEFAREKVAHLDKNELCFRDEVLNDLKKRESALTIVEREYNRPCFSELRGLLEGKPLPPPIKIQPVQESLGEKIVYFLGGVVGSVWLGFLGIGFIAALLFGLAGLIKGCEWQPTDADIKRLEYLP